jgi:hypothetical protein
LSTCRIVVEQSLLGAIGEMQSRRRISRRSARAARSGIRRHDALRLAFGCCPPTPEQPPQVAVVELQAESTKVPRSSGSSTSPSTTTSEEVARAKPKAKKPPANDNQTEDADPADGSNPADLAAVTMPEMVTIYAKQNCEPIAEVTREFSHQLKIQGTGKLKDGRVLNVWGHCGCGTSPCFKVIEHQWDTAGSGRPLQPFRTVAVDPKLIKLGSLLYVPLLEGRVMPGRAPFGGFVHDGCVVADDTGGRQQLDLFGQEGWFLGMSGSRGSRLGAPRAGLRRRQDSSGRAVAWPASPAAFSAA